MPGKIFPTLGHPSGSPDQTGTIGAVASGIAWERFPTLDHPLSAYTFFDAIDPLEITRSGLITKEANYHIGKPRKTQSVHCLGSVGKPQLH